MGFLIDSNILILAARGRYSLTRLGNEYPETILAISAITVSELLHGVHRTQEELRREKRQNFVDFILELFPVIPFDLEVARTHARLWARLAATGQMMGAHDLLIAATALTLNYGVLTANEREFRRIAELTVINPVAP